MKIESLKLRNFKCFKNVEIREFPRLCVVVGANGTGKSTLLDAFGFLQDCLTYNVRQALNRRGGYKGVISRAAKPGENIEIEIQFRLTIASLERLATYSLKIGPDRSSQPVVKREILRYRRGRYGPPVHFLDFAAGEGYAVSDEADFDGRNTELKRKAQSVGPDVLAIKGFGQFRRFTAANAFREFIENWQFTNLDIDAARGRKDATSYAEHLSVSGDNLPLVAKRIHDKHPDLFAKIIEAMQRRVPGMTDIQTVSTTDGRVLLTFQDGAFDGLFTDQQVSAGTIKILAYLALLNDPQPHPLLCVKEPENHIYHQLHAEMAEEFRQYAYRGSHALVATHSPSFLHAVELDEALWLVKEGGYTQIRRAKDDPQIAAYMTDGGDLGYLWRQGFFTGADPRW